MKCWLLFVCDWNVRLRRSRLFISYWKVWEGSGWCHCKRSKNFDGVDHLSAEQTDGIRNLIRPKDVLTGLPTVFGKSLLFPTDSWHLFWTKQHGLHSCAPERVSQCAADAPRDVFTSLIRRARKSLWSRTNFCFPASQIFLVFLIEIALVIENTDLSNLHVLMHVITVVDVRCDWLKCNAIRMIKIQREQ